MTCPVCESLHREHSELCEQEAKLILHERLTLVTKPSTAGESTEVVTRERILSSRKRQVRVASELASHKVRAHSA